MSDMTDQWIGFLSSGKGLGALLGVMGVLGAAIVAVCGVAMTNIITRRTKERELLISALQFLTGGTQRRSVGIAMLRKYALENKGLRELVLTVFAAQILHLRETHSLHGTSGRTIEKFNEWAMQYSIDTDLTHDSKFIAKALEKLKELKEKAEAPGEPHA
jgi:hypothetical protein